MAERYFVIRGLRTVSTGGDNEVALGPSAKASSASAAVICSRSLSNWLTMGQASVELEAVTVVGTTRAANNIDSPTEA